MTKKVKKILPIAFLALVAVCVTVFFSGCIDADYTVNVTKLQDNGYTVNSLEADGNISGAPSLIVATKGAGSQEEYVRILTFSAEDMAIDYYTGVFIEYSVPSFEALNPDLAARLVHMRVGKIVLFGTQAGVDDALA